MRLLVTGAKGLLATNIIPVLEEKHSIIPVDIDEWDIRDREAGRRLMALHQPEAVINCAAATNVDGCETDCDFAEAVNVRGTALVAELARDRAIPLIHISTDYVFDGTGTTPYSEDACPSPCSVYGSTKLRGEKELLSIHPRSVVIRTQWLYGKGGESFITKITAIGKRQGYVDVVDDQRGAPTYTKDLAVPIMTLLEKGLSGIYHVANSGSCTWFEFARAIFRLSGMNVDVRPVSSSQLARKAPRPAYSVFDLTKLHRDTGITMRSWKDALGEFLS